MKCKENKGAINSDALPEKEILDRETQVIYINIMENIKQMRLQPLLQHISNLIKTLAFSANEFFLTYLRSPEASW